jgi:hypothetical protein
MTAMQRRKGASGEREVSALIRDLTGWDVRRRVRQHDGDSDLEGAPGWSVEVKRHASATRGDIRQWWLQAAKQAQETRSTPVLLYRTNRDEWRAVWPLFALLDIPAAGWLDYTLTVEGTVEAWAAVARETT